MALTIAAPKVKVATYDVANQTDIQFAFELTPDQVRADGTTLVIEHEGNEVRLENFFSEDGTTHVQNFLTQDGQEFVATEFLGAIMDTNSETSQELETAAGEAGGSSGAGAYSDDPGSLFAALDAMGGQGDAYASQEPERLEEVEGPAVQGADNIIPFEGETRWDLFEERDGDFVYDTWYERLEYMPQPGEDSRANGLNVRQDSVVLDGDLRTFTSYVGTAAQDTLVLPDDDEGAALRLEDNLSLPGGGPGIQDIEVIQGGSGSDVVDLSSDVFTYGDVTVYGNGGNDYIWASVGNDTLSGGVGHDNMIGGLGNDVMSGDAGNDIMKGSVGDDTMSGGEGRDMIYGGDDNDVISGGAGSDVIYGGAGDDVIDGGAEADFILGGFGNDAIRGGGGNDLLVGEEGNDVIVAGTGTHDTVILGDGNDVVYIDSSCLTSGDTESVIWVNDFVNGEDALQWESGLEVLEWAWIDDGVSTDPALIIGDAASGDNTMVVFDAGMTFADVISSPGIDLSPTIEQEIQAAIDAGVVV